SSTDLGIYVTYAERYQSPEVIMSTQLAAAVAVIPFTSKVLGEAHPLWAVHSFDRVSHLASP
ncbi:uncharacterized protein TRAVEDRAFT_126739, partial [Trametes versicolor FP-101664 SS1]|uniref:uncharacterized protein n=1 Tax=Trametes versicolor (strain FP-101664) TaxID=717944 RepID=UPI00046244BB